MTRLRTPRRSRSAAIRRPKACMVALAITVGIVSTACSTALSPSQSPKASSHPATSSRPPSASPSQPSQPSQSSARSSRSPSPPIQQSVSPAAQIKKSCPSVLSWDDFHRSDRSLHRDHLPTGQRYYASGPDPQRIQDNQYVSKVRPQDPDILYVWLRRRPATVAARWVFTPGQTSGQNAVIGLAPRRAVIGHRHLLGFGIGSVQLAVHPQYWQLFYITNTNSSLQYHIVETRSFRQPLHQDGRTVYQMSMKLDPSGSSVMVTYPGGHTTVPNLAVGELWGKLFGIQVRRPHSGDGSARFLAAGASTAPCPARSLLGPTAPHRR